MTDDDLISKIFY